MNLTTLFKKQIPEEKSAFVLGIDLGTEYLKLSLMEIRDMDVQILQTKHSQHISGSLIQGYIADIVKVSERLSMSIREIVPEELLDTKLGVIWLMSGHFSKGCTSVMKFNRDNPSKEIEQKELDEFNQELIKYSHETATIEYEKEWGQHHSELQAIETKIIGYNLGGFEVSNPMSMVGQTLIATCYTSFCPLNHINNLKKLENQFNLDFRGYCILEQELVNELGGQDSHDFNSILIDLGGEVSTVSVNFSKAIVESKTIPIGGKAITRIIAEGFNFSMQKAENVKLSFDNFLEGLEDDDKLHLTDTCSNVREVIASSVALAIREMHSIKIFPSRVYVFGMAASDQELLDKISSETFEGISLSQNVKIIEVKVEDVEMANQSERKFQQQDLPLVIIKNYLKRNLK